ncbi:CCR4-NOT transcription complex subunit 4-like isoform X2 [Liolophura sinensis]|uniref:CCR4-NOT transcription complex subunit 4-like isoform X2 n=1 Tax=Liolophura sinensis TaxID=3198878 RepID=UPI003158555B
MSIGEEQVECPLCMEPLEMDDINFFPCTCGYQICRFCWHRIRTDENGLCPACRKQYQEDPAEFKPLTEDELQRIKKERRQKDLQRKQKAAENRKHLANVRVVQKNLVFVVGLSQRLAEPDVLKKHEYFGKFGKIHKVVINQSTSYAGSQGPSASAYVTYHKPEDALRAILAVNNVHIDGRTLKASLGTTKYCSHFLRGAQCPKGDCMYLHELGEEAASFTKEQMQLGKHQEYEQKLLEGFMNNQNSANNQLHVAVKSGSSKKRNTSPLTLPQSHQQHNSQLENGSPPSDPTPPPTSQMAPHVQTPSNSGQDAWPSLQPGGSKGESRGDKPVASGNKVANSAVTNHNPRSVTPTGNNRAPGNHRHKSSSSDTQQHTPNDSAVTTETEAPRPIPATVHNSQHSPIHIPPQIGHTYNSIPATANRRSLVFDNNNTDSLSLFSGNGFPTVRTPKPPAQPPTTVPETLPSTEIPETIPVSTTTDWQAAFGFSSKTKDIQDDDLGFDPWDESSKALADLMEKENGPNLVGHSSSNPHMSPRQMSGQHNHMNQMSGGLSIPPGFSLSYLNHHQNPLQQQQQQMMRPDLTGSRMMGLMNFPRSSMAPMQSTYPDRMADKSLHKDPMQNHMQQDAFNMKDWQDGLRALLPNINISFGGAPQQSSVPTAQTQKQPQTQTQKNWSCGNTQQKNTSWMANDPAIVTSGSIPDKSPPYWLKSIHHLTDYEAPSNNHRLPFVQQFPFGGPTWPPQTSNPPPGFQTLRPPTQQADSHTIAAESLQ